MTVRNLARISNHFESSDQSLSLDELLTTAEAAALLGISVRSLKSRAVWRGAGPRPGAGRHAYWTPRQIERLRGGRR